MKIYSFLFFFFSFFLFSQEKWTLKKCIEYALENNISIKQAEIDSKTQQQEVKRSKGAFLPDFRGATSQNFNFSKGYRNPTLGTTSSGNSSRFNVGLSSGMTLFNGFQNLNTYKKSLIDQSYSDTNIEIVKNDISLNIVNAYLQLLFSKEREAVSKSSLKLNELQYERIKLLYEKGSEAKATVYESEANIARAKQALVEAQNNIRSSKLNLTQILQLPFDPSFDVEAIAVKDLQDKLSLEDPKVIYEKALQIRPEIKYASLAVESANQAIKISKGAYLPRLNFGYNFGTNYYNVYLHNDDNFFEQIENNWNHTFSFSLNIPIFNRWATKTSAQRAILSKEKSELTLENEKYKLRKNIETAYVDALNAKKSYESAIKSVTSTKIALDYAKKRFEAGSANTYDFEQAKNNYISAQVDLTNAKYDYIFKVKVMQFYAGQSFTTTN